MCHGGNPKAILTWGTNYIRNHIVPNNEKNQAPAAIHSQTLQARNTLKYYQNFYLLKHFNITWLFHLREYWLYVLVQSDSILIL